MGSVRRRRSSAQWAQLISEYQTSGESQKVFCERKGVGLSTFYRWYQRRGGSNAERQTPDSGLFVDVTPRAVSATGVSLHIGEGLRIDCPPDMGVEAIARLAWAMRGGC